MRSHYPHAFRYTDQEYRHRPAEYCPLQKRWFQDGRKLRNVKPTKAFVWPKDGREGTSWDRFKDVMKNRGPDMYLTINADKHDYMHNRPTRAQWSGHTNLDDRGLLSATLSSKKFAPWTRIGMLNGRSPGECYDFRERTYGSPNRDMWTDAVWQPHPRKNKYSPWPEAIRNMYGEWAQDRHYLPRELGGFVSNEQGKGLRGFNLQPVRWRYG
ncbi:hypothetical protein EK21DRAFT_76861 [Setomelanomma holmii]|uniref:Uncharacterized protein n=1 Tax=Setomelanomma holmii TaxID=210430 RepID=A0A9P4LHJ7_9PLEO|nr:hypothetical protein EK21DRAFT_76861 [Setomelanomma holmii]